MKLNTFRMIFGFCFLIILAGLIGVVALGKVEESTSHGLMPLVTTLSTIGGMFAQWAFGSKNKKDKKKKTKETETV